MKEKLRFLGLDVHAEMIAVAIAESDGEVRSLGTVLVDVLKHLRQSFRWRVFSWP
jgi:hypothetical protein